MKIKNVQNFYWLLFVLVLVGSFAVQVARGESGTFPDEPFNGMQIDYVVNGASFTSKEDSYSFTTARVFKGNFGYNRELRVTGTARQKTKWTDPEKIAASVRVIVTVDGNQKDFTADIKSEGSQDFDVSIPVPEGATKGSFMIEMTGYYSAGTRGLVVSGELSGAPEGICKSISLTTDRTYVTTGQSPFELKAQVSGNGNRIPDGTLVEFSLEDYLGYLGNAWVDRSGLTVSSWVTVDFYPPDDSYWNVIDPRTNQPLHDPTNSNANRIKVTARCGEAENSYLLYIVPPATAAPPTTGTAMSGTGYDNGMGAPGGSVIYSNGNVGGVYNNPASPATFTLTNTYNVMSISTYHYNSGSGATPGTISLKDSSGKTVGKWTATGRYRNFYWDVTPNIKLGPGTYTVIDSDTSTWAQNSETNNQGMFIVKGTLATTTGKAPDVTVKKPTSSQQGDFTVSISPTEMTVEPGENIRFTLTVEPEGDFNEPVEIYVKTEALGQEKNFGRVKTIYPPYKPYVFESAVPDSIPKGTTITGYVTAKGGGLERDAGTVIVNVPGFGTLLAIVALGLVTLLRKRR